MTCVNEVNGAERRRGTRPSFECPEGYEVRGFRVRLYPTADQVEVLERIESECRIVWNTLVKYDDDAREARVAHAQLIGAVGPRPARPDFNGLAPDESKAAKDSYHDVCRERIAAALKATKHIEGFRRLRDLVDAAGVRWDYQLFRIWIRARLGGECVTNAGALQALAKSYQTWAKGQKPKGFRRQSDSMPLRTRTGDCFSLGSFGDRRGRPFYDCQVSFNGLKIRGRLPGRAPWGRVVEGVAIRREADGWWASIRQVVPVRELPAPAPATVVGIDVGLVDMVAFSEPVGGKLTIPNRRRNELSERIAGLQARASEFARGSVERRRIENRAARIHARLARHTKHTIYTDVVAPLATFETIKVERLQPKIGQMGSRSVSAMRLVVSMLRERYGDRVREVDCRFTSQDCSQCGHRSKDSWAYENGRVGQCPACGFSAHRDVNAARNIAAKPAEKEAA